MRKQTRLYCIISLLIFLTGCGIFDTELTDIKKRNVLRVGIKMDVPGFGYLNPETNELEGMEIDLAHALAKELIGKNAEVEFVGVTSKIRGPLLNNGGLDVVIATFTITEERLEQFNFSKPYYVDEIGFMVLKDSPIKGIADLDGKVIGVAQTGTAMDALKAEIEGQNINLTFKEFASYPEIVGALLNKEIDVFTVDKSILRGYLTEQTIILDDGFNPQDYGIATKLENNTLAQRVNLFVDTMKKSGELDKLIEKWDLK